MSNNKKVNEKRPGEKESGTFHYNPGNMSGKTGDDEKRHSPDAQNPGARENLQDKKS